MRVYHEKKSDGVRVDHEKKSDGQEFTITKSDGLRVDYRKKSHGVKVHHKKERLGESLP